jgi:uncharacterized membrane protein YdbT with pleckstrin-like domain
MSYVTRVLQPGETVRHTASLHWIFYWRGLLLCLVALVLFVLRREDGGFLHWAEVIGAWLFLAGGLILLGEAWFRWWTTEIAVTDRRVIYKTGFIQRKTTEMHMDKVESVEIRQSVLGRLLDYGDVEIRGVGIGLEPLRAIAAPLALRNHITAV